MSESDDLRSFAATLPPGEGRVRCLGGPIAEIVFDHPARKNALDAHMMIAFADAVDAIAAAGSALVILRGEGDAFCSGGDLKAVREHLVNPGVGACVQAWMAGAVDRLQQSGIFVLGVATGPALGGGAELLAACDLVFASPSARVGWVQARLGVSPGFGGGERLFRRVGVRRGLRLLVEAQVLTAAEAAEVGLVDRIDADPLDAAREWAKRALALPPEALRGAVGVARGFAGGAPEGRRVERGVFESLWGSEAHLAALERAGRR